MILDSGLLFLSHPVCTYMRNTDIGCSSRAVFAGNAIDIALTHDHDDRSSLFLLLSIFTFPKYCAKVRNISVFIYTARLCCNSTADVRSMLQAILQ